MGHKKLSLILFQESSFVDRFLSLLVLTQRELTQPRAHRCSRVVICRIYVWQLFPDHEDTCCFSGDTWDSECSCQELRAEEEAGF